jgi:hypothetical protein
MKLTKITPTNSGLAFYRLRKALGGESRCLQTIKIKKR